MHKDTAQPTRKALVEAMQKTYQDPEFKKGLDVIGEENRFAGPDSMARTIRESEGIAAPISKELGLYVSK